MSSAVLPTAAPRQWAGQMVYLRDLVLELVGRDVKIQFKRSSLGVIWSLANPLFQFFVFGFLFAKVLSVSVPRYSTHAFTGLLVWTWFQAALTQGVRAMTGNRELIKRPGFPVSILPIVAVVTPWVHFLWALPVLFLFILLDKAPIGWAVSFLPVLMLLQGLLSLSLVYLLAALNVVFRDTQHILGVVLQVVLFATPIFYQASLIPAKYRFIYTFNPLAQLIDAYRTVLLEAKLPEFRPLALLALFGLVVLAARFACFTT